MKKLLRPASPFDVAYVAKGGPGSGNFGHSGRPGEIGGSAAGGVTTAETGRSSRKAAEDFVTANKEAILASRRVGTNPATKEPIMATRPSEQREIERVGNEYLRSRGFESGEISRLRFAQKEWGTEVDKPDALAMRKAVAQEIGRDWQDEYHYKGSDTVAAEWSERDREVLLAHRDYVRAVARAEYGDKLTVSRFIGGEQGKAIADALARGETEIGLGVNSISSWTRDFGVADSFSRGAAGVIVTQEVSVDDIWDDGLYSDQYSFGEKEVVVASKEPVKKFKAGNFFVKEGVGAGVKKSEKLTVIPIDGDKDNANWLRKKSKAKS